MTDLPVDELLPALADLDHELGRRAQPDEPACDEPGPHGPCGRLPHTTGWHAHVGEGGLVLW